ncbi:uncharacterized protein LOC111259647 [Varroa jacobsoni]|uniref:Glutathione peroxidase n=1 Tax=Varroa destructor TaxID=109461 RepID=A0A7M7KWW1_VARDE|nr:uncharacterized protein LOC111254008 [Varroa destructor]XP_022687554.1 uncharacterized protein LOC111259647 [Varroa jacobsoni]
MAEVDPKKATSIYEFTVKNIDGDEVKLDKYRGKVVLIVNVASKCGYTGQYEGLEKLHQKYKDRGFAILGFPCNQFKSQEPGNEREIKEFCSLKYNVTFDMFKKINVNGSHAEPLWVYLKKEQHGFLIDAIKWNFTKFLINKEGKPVKRFSPADEPVTLEADIEALFA